MKCRDVKYLLAELADGTLQSDEKARVEEHIARCEECAMDAALMNDTFAALRTDVLDLPPEHYFSTLLPKVRTRLEKKDHAWGLPLPGWFEKAVAPLTVTAMALIIVALFRAFEPGEEYSPLKSIVEQVSGDEIVSLVATPAEPYAGEFGLPANDKLLDATPNANSIADRMKSELLAGELPLQQTEPGTLTVEKTLDELDDDAVAQVLERMNEHTTL